MSEKGDISDKYYIGHLVPARKPCPWRDHGKGEMEGSMKIEDVLRDKGHQVETCTHDTPVHDVSLQLYRKSIGALVVSRDGAHIDGIISERDIVLGFAHDAAGLVHRTARELMTTRVITCSPEDHLTGVMAIISSRRVRHLPVVKDGRLVGIISIGDVLKARLEEVELEANVLRDVYLAGHAY
jgi:CBS domain-containing protein